MAGSLSTLVQKNIVLRKSFGLVQQIPRTYRRMTASTADYQNCPPILVNSFPKSGTHLLLQMMQGLPGVTHYGTFLASMPPKPHLERSIATHLRMIGRLAPGEVIPAHLFFHPKYLEGLGAKCVIQFFIYRDPRDVVISEAHYLAEMHRWHDLHPYFARLKTYEERISFSIQGAAQSEFPFDYPDVGQRFERYRPWLEEKNVFSLRFEDIIGIDRDESLNQIANHLIKHGFPNRMSGSLAHRLDENIDPKNSRTFRKGTIGQWRQVFTADLKKQMKSVAGQLLIDLGYETSLDW